MAVLLHPCGVCRQSYAYQPNAARCCLDSEGHKKIRRRTRSEIEERAARIAKNKTNKSYSKEYHAKWYHINKERKNKKAEEIDEGELKAHKFPIASAPQLEQIELIEFEKGIIFKGTSKVEAAKFIKENT
jgi:hypothetical protein